MGKIFISYSRHDSDFVDQLMPELEQRGFEIWMDREDIGGGAAWRASISQAIRECEALITVLSPASTDSTNVTKEVSLADQHRRPIIPIFYQRCPIPPALEYVLAELQIVDFAGTVTEEAVNRLTEALSAHVARSPEPTSSPGRLESKTPLLPLPGDPPPTPPMREGDGWGKTKDARSKPMSEVRFYPGCANRVGDLTDHLCRKYELAGYEVQMLHVKEHPGAGIIFQMRQKYTAGWKQLTSQLTGLDIAATVTIRAEGDGLSIEVGGGKWLDKAAVAGFATFVTPGVLIIPAGIGAWKQRKLLGELTTEIDNFFKRWPKGPASCPQCDTMNTPGAKFCSECATPLVWETERSARSLRFFN